MSLPFSARLFPLLLWSLMIACAASWWFTGNARAGGMVPALLVLYIIAVNRARRTGPRPLDTLQARQDR
jgi:hypothetical protein